MTILNLKFFPKKFATWVRLEPTTFASMHTAHRANHLCHRGWKSHQSFSCYNIMSQFPAGHFVTSWFAAGNFWICSGSISEFAAGLYLNLQRVYIWICSGSISEFAAGLYLNLQQVYVWFSGGPYCKSEFAAGDITKLNLQQVILQKPICSRSMSEFAAGHFAKS